MRGNGKSLQATIENCSFPVCKSRILIKPAAEREAFLSLSNDYCGEK